MGFKPQGPLWPRFSLFFPFDLISCQWVSWQVKRCLNGCNGCASHVAGPVAGGLLAPGDGFRPPMGTWHWPAVRVSLLSVRERERECVCVSVCLASQSSLKPRVNLMPYRQSLNFLHVILYWISYSNRPPYVLSSIHDSRFRSLTLGAKFCVEPNAQVKKCQVPHPAAKIKTTPGLAK